MKFDQPTPKTGGSFLTIEPGGSVKGLLQGEPLVYYQHWDGQSYLPCQGESCQGCKRGDRKNFKFKINILIIENGAILAKILTGPSMMYTALGELAKHCDLEKYPVVINRQGTGKNTKYTVFPSPTGELKPEHLEKFKAVPLLPLSIPGAKEMREPGDDKDDPIPF